MTARRAQCNKNQVTAKMDISSRRSIYVLPMHHAASRIRCTKLACKYICIFIFIPQTTTYLRHLRYGLRVGFVFIMRLCIYIYVRSNYTHQLWQDERQIKTHTHIDVSAAMKIKHCNIDFFSGSRSLNVFGAQVTDVLRTVAGRYIGSIRCGKRRSVAGRIYSGI